MTEAVFPIEQFQKVEYKASPDFCNIAFTGHTDPKFGSNKTLMITNIPAGAGSTLASAAYEPFFRPSGEVMMKVYVEFGDTEPSQTEADVLYAPYAGRIEIREF